MRVLIGTPRERPGWAAAGEALLRGEEAALPEPRVDFLRWLAATRPVAFHGSQRDDVTELSTERTSSDTTAWGNQTAVYASSDPIWAIYFAVLRRDGGFRGTRNGALRAGPLRLYFFAHNREAESPERFGPGTLYLLPSGTFEAQPSVLGIDPCHLVSHVPVQPLARVPVTPEDFPFRDAVVHYRQREPIWVSMFRL